MYYMGDVDAPMRRGTFKGVCPIEEYCKTEFWDWLKGWAVQKMGGPILTIYTSYNVVLVNELHLWVTMIAPALKFLVALIF